MNKIDVTKWQTFTIEDLFDKCELKYKKEKFNKASDISTTRTEEFNLPLVNAKHFNNGIMYYGRSSDFESEAMTIDIVADGAASTGDVYAQPQETGVLYNAYLIKPKFEPTENILLYFSTIIQTSIKKKFGYQNKCTWDKVKHLEILLPVISANTPDWAYMESYMKDIMRESEKKLENLQNISEYKNKIDVKNWQEFLLGGNDGLFNIVKGTRLTKANMKEGNINFIGSSAINNGVTNHILNSERVHPANLITVSYNGSIGEAFYQAEPFWASDDVNVFYPKFEQNFEIAMFLIPLIRKVGEKYKFVDKWKLEDMCNDKIKLPVNKSGEPDWEYMENYMKNIMQESEWNIQKLQKLDCCK